MILILGKIEKIQGIKFPTCLPGWDIFKKQFL